MLRLLLCGGGFGEVLFVDRRELTEAGYGGGDEFERSVDVRVGVLAGEREAQTGARAGERQPHGFEDVGGLGGTGGAGRPAGDGETLEVERDNQRFAFEVVEVEVGRVGDPRLAGA